MPELPGGGGEASEFAHYTPEEIEKWRQKQMEQHKRKTRRPSLRAQCLEESRHAVAAMELGAEQAMSVIFKGVQASGNQSETRVKWPVTMGKRRLYYQAVVALAGGGPSDEEQAVEFALLFTDGNAPAAEMLMTHARSDAADVMAKPGVAERVDRVAEELKKTPRGKGLVLTPNGAGRPGKSQSSSSEVRRRR